MKEIISYGRFRCTELSPHKNRGMEITYIEKGMLEWMAEGTSEKVEAGSIYFTLPWQVHGSLNPREPDNTIWHILFHLEEDYPRPRKQFRLPQSLGFSAGEMKTVSSVFASSSKHCFPVTETMRRLMPELIAELQSSHELREAQTRTLLRAVLVELKRIVNGEAVNEKINSWSEKRVQDLLSELDVTCEHHWTLAEMADFCGIQRTRLNTIFRKMTASTPMEYLGRLRMERAKTLLRETEMKVIDIAFECGFSSSQYFANTFRHTTGLAPSVYRSHCAGLTEAEFEKWSDIDFRSEQEERRRVRTFLADKDGT